ncbi:hypothetical protein ARMGADRAFT_1031354 [Armillaria gallica]|uniref:Uncharacterized protein n=1 Tax=Armillaria gallica TaxID=47427 RepID=A0A2H3DK72_ARMGA|nr:hypothetical protein ARMGADRAFT_1031354 [Armillaria gallica]
MAGIIQHHVGADQGAGVGGAPALGMDDGFHRCIHYKPRLNAEHFKDDHATPVGDYDRTEWGMGEKPRSISHAISDAFPKRKEYFVIEGRNESEKTLGAMARMRLVDGDMGAKLFCWPQPLDARVARMAMVGGKEGAISDGTKKGVIIYPSGGS